MREIAFLCLEMILFGVFFFFSFFLLSHATHIASSPSHSHSHTHTHTHTHFPSLSLPCTYQRAHSWNSHPALVTQSFFLIIYQVVSACLLKRPCLLCVGVVCAVWSQWRYVAPLPTATTTTTTPPANNCHLALQCSTALYVLSALERVQK